MKEGYIETVEKKTVKYVGVVKEELKDVYKRIEWPKNTTVRFTEKQYEKGFITRCVGHGQFLDLLKEEVHFTHKEITEVIHRVCNLKLLKDE